MARLSIKIFPLWKSSLKIDQHGKLEVVWKLAIGTPIWFIPMAPTPVTSSWTWASPALLRQFWPPCSSPFCTLFVGRRSWPMRRVGVTMMLCTTVLWLCLPSALEACDLKIPTCGYAHCISWWEWQSYQLVATFCIKKSPPPYKNTKLSNEETEFCWQK